MNFCLIIKTKKDVCVFVHALVSIPSYLDYICLGQLTVVVLQ